jgi:phospholipid N-methyltransferase
MKKGLLFKELFTNIGTTGAITFSSKSLVDKMLSFVDFKGAKILVELGGGDGSITKGIVERMDSDGKLLVFEISRNFCDNLEKMFPQENVVIICDSAENLDKYLDQVKADFILSSLPFSLIPKPIRTQIYRKSKDSVTEEGKFIQICYSYLLKYQFADYFSEVKTSFTLKNFPPAFIMICN